jgi:hypothetical protein
MELTAVHTSEDFLRMMIDKIPILAWSCWPDGTTEFLNQRWLGVRAPWSDRSFRRTTKCSTHSLPVVDENKKVKDARTRSP